jgi:hypothetical protein
MRRSLLYPFILFARVYEGKNPFDPILASWQPQLGMYPCMADPAEGEQVLGAVVSLVAVDVVNVQTLGGSTKGTLMFIASKDMRAKGLPLF